MATGLPLWAPLFPDPVSFFPFTFLGPLVLKCHLIQAPQLFPGRLPLHATFHSLLPIPRPVYIRPPCSCALLLYSPFSFSVHGPVSIFVAVALPFRPAWSSHSMACRFSSFPAVSHPFSCVPSCLAACLLAVWARGRTVRWADRKLGGHGAEPSVRIRWHLAYTEGQPGLQANGG